MRSRFIHVLLLLLLLGGGLTGVGRAFDPVNDDPDPAFVARDDHRRSANRGCAPRLASLMERLWAGAEAAYRRKILDTLNPAPGAVLLDVGCDDGAWTERLRRKLRLPAHQVLGLEIVPERAERARARGFDVRTGDLDEPWPFADASVDVVHANQVIEHVRRLDHFVAEIRRVLAPGGLAIVCTENLASWHNVAALSFGYQPFSATNVSNLRPIGNRLALHAAETPTGESWQHVHVMTLAGLRDLFTAHGFTVQGHVGHRVPPSAASARRAPGASRPAARPFRGRRRARIRRRLGGADHQGRRLGRRPVCNRSAPANRANANELVASQFTCDS
jgi:SAM-dependent methyltransferase